MSVAVVVTLTAVLLSGVAGVLCGRSVRRMRHRTTAERLLPVPPALLAWSVPAMSVVSSAMLTWWLVPDRWTWLLPMLPFSVLGAWLSAIDVDVHRLPNRLLKPLAGALLLTTAVAAVIEGHPGHLVVGSALALAVLVGFGILNRLQPGGTGGGDIKLMILISFTLGGLTGSFVTVCAAMLLAGALTILGALALRHTKAIVFGPGLYAGTVVAVLLAATS